MDQHAEEWTKPGPQVGTWVNPACGPEPDPEHPDPADLAEAAAEAEAIRAADGIEARPPAWHAAVSAWPLSRQVEFSERSANAMRVAKILERPLTPAEAESDTHEQMTAETRHAARARPAGNVPVARPAPSPAPPSSHWWRPLIARRPQADRQSFGDRANALADEGIPFPAHEELAYVELWGRPERMPTTPAPSAGLDERGWSADGLTWTAPEALGINFDWGPIESSPRERPEPADDDEPRPYLGRTRRSSADEPIDPVAAAIKSVEQWREAGLGFLETSKKWPDPQDRAIYRSLAAGLLKHGLDEARAAGLDDSLIADLARELAEASQTVA